MWDGERLKLTFRRSVSEYLMSLWYELLGIAKSINLKEESDQIIWSFNSNGKYSVQSLYAVINHRGVVPVYAHAVWKLSIPPRVQVFLWLMAKNKILTRDNLGKRRELFDKTCLFCAEFESVHHLLFDCYIAARIWSAIAEILELGGVWNFESVATRWIANKKNLCINIITSAVLWSIWKFRNKMYFQGLVWTGEKEMMLWITRTLRGWRALLSQDLASNVDQIVMMIENKAHQPPRLCWETSGAGASASQPSAPDYVPAIQLDVEENEFCNPGINVCGGGGLTRLFEAMFFHFCETLAGAPIRSVRKL